MTLPLLLSVPHAGCVIPDEVAGDCILDTASVLEDRDGGVQEIYFPLAEKVAGFYTSQVARSIVDLNRHREDFSCDGVIKTRSSWNRRVYRRRIPDATQQGILRRYYDPYHQSLSRVGPRVPLGVDCHTMSPIGPTLGPDPGRRRPAVCLSDAFGTCPGEWVSFLARELQEALGEPVALNRPFKGGHIIRSHACETAWIQVEFSRTCYTTNQKKSRALLRALSGLSKRWG